MGMVYKILPESKTVPAPVLGSKAKALGGMVTVLLPTLMANRFT